MHIDFTKIENNLELLLTEYTIILNQTITNFQNKHSLIKQQVKFAIEEPEIFNRPTLAGTTSWQNYTVMEDYQKMKIDLKNARDQFLEKEDNKDLKSIFADIDPLTQNLRRLVNQFFNDIKSNNIYENFLKFDNIDHLTKYQWTQDIKNLSNSSIFPSKSYNTQVPMAIRWSLLIDSYLRDTEILINKIINLVLPDLISQTYGIKIQKFFELTGKLYYFLNKNVLKPWLRHKIAHQYFHINFKESKIIFFETKEYDIRGEKSMIFEEFEEIVKHLNIFMLYLMDEFTGQQSSQNLEYNKPELLTKYESLVDYSNDVQLLVQSYEGYLPLAFNYQEIPIQEIILFYRAFTTKKINRELFYNAHERISYLVNFTVIEENLLKPFYYSMKGITLPPKHQIKSRQLYDYFVKFKNAKYNEILAHFDVSLRNSIAHIGYSTRINGIINYKTDKMVYPLISAMKLSMLSFYIDSEIVPNSEQASLVNGIAELVVDLFFPKSRVERSQNYYISSIQILTKEKKYNWLIGCVFLFLSYFENDPPSQEFLLNKAYSVFNERTKAKELFYIYSYSLMFDSRNKTELEDIPRILKFGQLVIDFPNKKLLVKTSEMKRYLVFKAMVHLLSKDRPAALNTLKQIRKLNL